jgi:HAD superfamily hydrolase (TIGR01509 family)
VSERQIPWSDIDTFLLDGDGTIYDSDNLQFLANYNTSRDLYGHEYSRHDYDLNVRQGNERSFNVLLSKGINVDAKQWYDAKIKAYKELAKDLKPMPDALDFLEWCKKQNKVCALVSAAGLDYVDASLESLKIRDYFKFVISDNDVSPKTKPHPYPYELGLKLTGRSPEKALAVEDTAKGIASAKAAGLYCVGIRNDSNNDSELANADLIIDDFSELINKFSF